MEEIIKKEDSPEFLPWYRGEEEPEEAYRMFEIYLALGTARSLRRMAYNYKASVSKLKEWSARWNWVSRATLYDKLKTELLRNEVLTDIEVLNLNNDLRQVKIEKSNLYDFYNENGLADMMPGKDEKFPGPDTQNWEKELPPLSEALKIIAAEDKDEI